MKTVAEIRHYVRMNRHELSADQLEELEVQMMELEQAECNPVDLSGKAVHNAVVAISGHRNRNSDKVYHAVEWLMGLSEKDRAFALANLETIYKKNTKDRFIHAMVR